MIKISDCNNCADRNCQESTFNHLQWNCKKGQPPQAQKLSKLAEVVLSRNPQALYDCLKSVGATLPTNLKA